MSDGIHVLVCCILGHKLSIASFAFKAWRPVICGVHVLITSRSGAKGTGAGLAFGPVATVIHVILPLILVPEVYCTALALVHLVIKTLACYQVEGGQ
jgi:hypothetical protein